ncbi:hypothetical protein [Lysobacter gummosus]
MGRSGPGADGVREQPGRARLTVATGKRQGGRRARPSRAASFTPA